MNSAEIVKREVQGESGFQVRQLFAERIREPRKAPHRHAHREVSPLAFCEETSQDNLGSEAWVTPRFGLTPPTARTADGALNQLLRLWWRSGHGLLPAFLKRSALESRGVSHLRPKSFLRLFVAAHSRRKSRIRLGIDADLLVTGAGCIHRNEAIRASYRCPAIHLAISPRFRYQFIGHHSFECRVDGRERIRCVVGEIKTSSQKRLSNLYGRHPLFPLAQNIAAAFGQGLLNVRTSYLRFQRHLAYAFHSFHRFGHADGGFSHQFGRDFLSSCVERKTLKRCLNAFKLALDLVGSGLESFALDPNLLAFVYQSIKLSAQARNHRGKVNVFNHVRSLRHV
jgi:hypothetical protein